MLSEAITVSLGWTALMKLDKAGGKLSAYLEEALKQFLDTPPAEGKPAAATPDATSEDPVSLKVEWKLPDELHAKLKSSGADPQQIISLAVAAYIHKYWPPPLPKNTSPRGYSGTYLVKDFSVGIASCVYDELSAMAKARCVEPGSLILEAIRRYVKDPDLALKFDWKGAFGEVRNDLIEPMGGSSGIKFNKCPPELERDSERARGRKVRAAMRAFVATGG